MHLTRLFYGYGHPRLQCHLVWFCCYNRADAKMALLRTKMSIHYHKRLINVPNL